MNRLNQQPNPISIWITPKVHKQFNIDSGIVFHQTKDESLAINFKFRSQPESYQYKYNFIFLILYR